MEIVPADQLQREPHAMHPPAVPVTAWTVFHTGPGQFPVVLTDPVADALSLSFSLGGSSQAQVASERNKSQDLERTIGRSSYRDFEA